MIKNNNKAVAWWLLVGAAMIIIQVLLGGLTRLTDSGLSITEWQPILGTIPPLNNEQWQTAFDNYKELAQFKFLHSHFNLNDFKFIYFWEWFHRIWARLMGVVFIIPFLFFIYKKWINKTMLTPLIILFLLGGLQGFVGWFMVKSGVGTSLVFVDHTRLAIHFIAALILLIYVIWFALKLIVPQTEIIIVPKVNRWNKILIWVLTIQLIYGAFMAGSRAAYASITWPSINGYFYPPGSINKQHFLFDIVNNLLAIQFIHRLLAYILLILVFMFTFQLKNIKGGRFFKSIKYLPFYLVTVQVVLGIITLINYSTNYKLILSITHQFVGMLLLVSLFFTLFVIRKSK
jgi:cytochrome c oxidase assembly protein subunit 15